jgi:hypothetical protein
LTDLFADTPFANKFTTKVHPDLGFDFDSNKNDENETVFVVDDNGKILVPRPGPKMDNSWPGHRPHFILAGIESSLNSEQYETTFRNFVKLFKNENEIVKNGLLLKQQKGQQQQHQQQQYLTMPLNCNKGRMRMSSYPMNFDAGIHDKNYNNPGLNRQKLVEARQQNSPVLDLIYKACDAAQVDCGHIYLHRPPDQIIKSTVYNRSFHNSILEAIQSYTTIFQKIQSDLRKHSSRNWGCIGLYDNDVSDALKSFAGKELPEGNNSNININYPSWFNITPALLGFENSSDWARYMSSKLKPPTTDTSTKRKEKKADKFKINYDKHKELEIYKMFIEQHHRTVQVCKDNIVTIT